MALKVQTRFPGANAKVLRCTVTADEARVDFAAHPHGGADALWFCFRLLEDDSSAPHPERITLRLRFVEGLPGETDPESMRPAYQPEGKNWFRCNAAHPVRRDDGSLDVEWTIPYPAPETLIALSFPYQRDELQRLLQRCRGFWQVDAIGLSQDGRLLERVSNDYGTAQGKRPGVYLLARRYAGETPGSWLLDGMLDRFSREKKQPFVAWALPFADVDGVVQGAHGTDAFAVDRHEYARLREDLKRWAHRCKPMLVVDLRASAGCERSGVFAALPSPEADREAYQAAQSWANVLAEALGADYAAPDFGRVSDDSAPSAGDPLDDFVRTECGIPALRLEIPYALCGTTMMTHKAYRDAGRLIAKAILQRLRK